MRIQNFFALAILAAGVLAIAGCHKQGDANAELAKAVKTLEQADPGQTPPPTFTPAPAAGATAPAAQPNQQPVTTQPVAAQMNQAMTAYKSEDYLDAVTWPKLLRTKVSSDPAAAHGDPGRDGRRHGRTLHPRGER